MIDIITIVGFGVAGLTGIGLIIQTKRINTINMAKQKSDTIVQEANKQANRIVNGAKSQADKEANAIIRRAEDDVKFKQRQMRDLEEEVRKKRLRIDNDQRDAEKLKTFYDEKLNSIKQLKLKQDDIVQQLFAKLESVASLTKEEAEKSIISHVELIAKKKAGQRIKLIEEETLKVAKRRATEIILESVQKLGVEVISTSTTSVVILPDDEIKGRIIGKEGRNIRVFESISGVDVIIDDTPNGVIISCFDPIRREIARMSLEKLVADGRINPARIEDSLDKSKKELQQIIIQRGEKAADELNLNFDPYIIEMLGRLNYRTSYGQNILEHSIEVSKIAGIIAERLGLNTELSMRGGVLHDIGKAIDFVHGGSHDDLGAEICRKYGESPEVLNCIMAHHEEEDPETLEALIVKIADALSSARPGARKESVEVYLKRLSNLENIVQEFDGVDYAYAIQAGREVRVIVSPDEITDDGVYKLSQDIAQKIEREMDYPGEIKVNIIRELRATAIAH